MRQPKKIIRTEDEGAGAKSTRSATTASRRMDDTMVMVFIVLRQLWQYDHRAIDHRGSLWAPPQTEFWLMPPPGAGDRRVRRQPSWVLLALSGAPRPQAACVPTSWVARPWAPSRLSGREEGPSARAPGALSQRRGASTRHQGATHLGRGSCLSSLASLDEGPDACAHERLLSADGVLYAIKRGLDGSVYLQRPEHSERNNI